MKKKLFRLKKEKMIADVCGSIAIF